MASSVMVFGVLCLLALAGAEQTCRTSSLLQLGSQATQGHHPASVTQEHSDGRSEAVECTSDGWCNIDVCFDLVMHNQHNSLGGGSQSNDFFAEKLSEASDECSSGTGCHFWPEYSQGQDDASTLSPFEICTNCIAIHEKYDQIGNKCKTGLGGRTDCDGVSTLPPPGANSAKNKFEWADYSMDTIGNFDYLGANRLRSKIWSGKSEEQLQQTYDPTAHAKADHVVRVAIPTDGEGNYNSRYVTDKKGTGEENWFYYTLKITNC